jgi:thiamine-phosphate pyrophosphorylase
VYPIVDAAALGGRDPGEVVRALGRGGARLIQLRAKELRDLALVDLASQAVAAARAVGALLVVNDRPDVARIVGAHGVHVGQDDLPPQACRRVLGEDVLVGLSTHNLAQLEAAAGEPVDYVAVGPVFATRSKAAPDPVVGLELLGRARRLLARSRTHKPLVAIGGISLSNARAVVEAGADGVAVVSALMQAEDLAAAFGELQAALGSARFSPGPRDPLG